MKPYTYSRRIHYYETDAMAVVHHSNHLRLFEEARVAWFREREMDKITWSEDQLYFPLLESGVKYIKPIFFDDEIEVKLQVKITGRRFLFQYAIYLVTEGVDDRAKAFAKSRGALPLLCATGQTTHALVDRSFSVVKNLNPKIVKVMEAESWTETWP